MNRALVSFCLAACLAAPAAAAERPPSRIDYPGFSELTREVAPYRTKRLVTLARFNALAQDPATLILDARTPAAYAAGHIQGAVNLPLTDFTAGDLERVVGSPRRRILIYCNNNFSGDAEPVRTKSVRLALNIQTFINLYGYGYRNVYELADTVDMTDPEVGWVSGEPVSTPAPSAG